MRHAKWSLRFPIQFGLLLAGLLGGSVHAGHLNYHYVYTSKPFTTAFTSVYYEYPPPYDVRVDEGVEIMSVAFTSSSLLTAPGSYKDILPFSISVQPESVYSAFYYPRELVSPTPYPTNPLGCGGVEYPCYDTVFDILGVDDAGLPTGWNIGINYYYNAPTGRFTQTAISTTTGQEDTFGGYEGFFAYAGQLTNQPGSWSVTAIPEPATGALVLAALGAGVVIRGRRPAAC